MVDLRFLNEFRNVMSAGVVWGALTFVLHNFIMAPMPLPIAILLAYTVLFPGMVGHVVVANAFRSLVVVAGYRFYAYVPNLFTETLGAVISMLIGLAVAYVVWLMLKTKQK